jgi:hypothetical protein
VHDFRDNDIHNTDRSYDMFNLGQLAAAHAATIGQVGDVLEASAATVTAPGPSLRPSQQEVSLH